MRGPILALLAKSPAHGYEVRQRLVEALGPPGQALNPGQVYVTLSRLDRAGLVRVGQVSQQRHPDKKMYELTAAGSERVAEWLADVSWSKVTPTDFHLKLVAAAATGLADPVALVDAQRHELLRQLSEVQALTFAGSSCASSAGSNASLSPTEPAVPAGPTVTRSDERGRGRGGCRPGADEDLCGQWCARAGGRRCRSRGRGRRDRVGDGTERLRQVHTPAPAGRAGTPGSRRDRARRPPGRRPVGDGVGGAAPPHDRLRVPGLQPGRRADRGRER